MAQVLLAVVRLFSYAEWRLLRCKESLRTLHVQYNYKENAVQIVNCFYQDFTGLKVTGSVFDFYAKEIFSKEVTTGILADESKILFKLDLPNELTNIYFVKLRLQDKAGKEISSISIGYRPRVTRMPTSQI